MDDRGFAGVAHIVIARKALPAMEATAGIPTQADRLPHCDDLCVRPDCHDLADCFMARNERICRHPPFIVQHRKIGVANPAILNFDFDLVVRKRAWIVRKPL